MSNKEIHELLQEESLSQEIKNKVKLYLEWNLLTDQLKYLDRVDSIQDYKKMYKEDKVLSGSKNLEKMILLKQENLHFIDYLNSFKTEDKNLNQLKKLFQSYHCISCSILQHKNVPTYIKKQIDKINERDKSQILGRFNQLLSLIEKNKMRTAEKENAGAKDFEIERATMDYFGLSYSQIINSLNKTNFKFEYQPTKNIGLNINFETGRKNLGIMNVILMATKINYKIPLMSIGQFK